MLKLASMFLASGFSSILMGFCGSLSIINAVACVSSSSTETSVRTDVGKFRYQPQKIDVGTVYHYVKTNIDQTNPEHVSLYVATKERLESFKFHPEAPGSRAGLVIAEMDWSTFSAKRLESWQVYSAEQRTHFGTLTYAHETGAIMLDVPTIGKQTVEIRHLPFHVYNFDLASLNFAFRHLIALQGSFTVGIADPTFKTDGPLFHYKGEVEIRYISDEDRYGYACRKYAINGVGLDNRGGVIYVSKDGEYVVDLEIDLPDNPDWQNFKFRLLKVEEMSDTNWQLFIKSHFAKTE